LFAQGRVSGSLESSRSNLASAEIWAAQTRAGFQAFLSGREHLSADCEAYYAERVAGVELKTLLDNFAGAVKRFQTRLENEADTYRKGVQDYNNRFNALLSFDPEEAAEAAEALKRLEDSELPLYREKIRRARTEAEQQFKEHFVSRLNEYIEEARESFREINDTLKSLSFGRDQYRFTLEEKSDRRGQLEVIRKAAQISELEGGLFATLVDGDERRAVEALFEKILRNDLDSRDVRDLCDYRTYFTYDIRMKDITVLDSRTGRSPELSLSKVIREKSGGEAQTPYYVAIAAGFYRFYKDKPEETIRLVLFDEAFNRMDDERIGVALDFFRRLKMQIVTAVPTEKLETIAPYMDSIALIVRHGHTAMVRAFKSGALAERGAQAGSKADAAESRPRRPPISKELADVSDPDAQGALPIEPMLPEE
jgi:uncharacterized protein YPO0396